MREIDERPPEWFTAALSAPVEHDSTVVDGAEVEYRAWGAAGAPGVMLVHGAAAHARWWDHIGPFLATQCRVVALSLSGHGDSGRRTSYTAQGWADELLAVASAAKADNSLAVIAHSMGGQPAALLAGRHDLYLRGIVFVDWAAREISAQRVRDMRSRAFRRYRPRPDLETAVATFRPRPTAPDALPYVIDHVARTSFRHAADGTWQLAFDPVMYNRIPVVLDDLGDAACPTLLLRAEHSLITDDVARAFARRLGQRHRQVELPGAHHHVMLGQPLTLIGALATQLANWS